MNTLLTPDVIARETLIDIEDKLVFTQTMDRNYTEEWANKTIGDEITLRRFGDVTAHVKENDTDPLVFGEITETGQKLKIDLHIYVALKVTSKELTLDVADFQKQVSHRAVKAIAKLQEQKNIALIKKVNRYAEHVAGVPKSDTDIANLEAQTVIQNFTSQPIYLMNALTKSSLITGENSKMYSASVSDDGGEAFRTANFGKILGIQGLVTNMLPVKEYSEATTATLNALVLASNSPAILNVNGLDAAVFEGDILEFTNPDSSKVNVVLTQGAEAGDSVILNVPYVESQIEAGAVATVKSVGYGCVYQKETFVTAVIPLMPMLGGAVSDYAYDEETGQGVRVTFNSKDLDNIVIYDALSGSDLANRALAFRTDLK